MSPMSGDFGPTLLEQLRSAASRRSRLLEMAAAWPREDSGLYSIIRNTRHEAAGALWPVFCVKVSVSVSVSSGWNPRRLPSSEVTGCGTEIGSHANLTINMEARLGRGDFRRSLPGSGLHESHYGWIPARFRRLSCGSTPVH
jgi:hypothetical protein